MRLEQCLYSAESSHLSPLCSTSLPLSCCDHQNAAKSRDSSPCPKYLPSVCHPFATGDKAPVTSGFCPTRGRATLCYRPENIPKFAQHLISSHSFLPPDSIVHHLAYPSRTPCRRLAPPPPQSPSLHKGNVHLPPPSLQSTPTCILFEAAPNHGAVTFSPPYV